MVLTRRAFLRQTSLILATLGLSDIALSQISRRYHQVLAASAPRKLALLVGINQYDPQAKLPSLKGCLTDLELQREVLIHRFGFRRDDIKVLSDEQATHSNIETAFSEHLIGQASPKDVVVFHFSGYGRQVQLRTPALVDTPTAYKTQNALITADAVLPTATDDMSPILNGVLEETLLLLLRSLPTNQVATVLDTGFAYPGSEVLGHLRVRSLPMSNSGQFGIADRAFQLRWRAQTKALRAKIQKQGSSTPGVMLAANQTTQTALESHWHDFAAGLFTYALTQYLWNTVPAKTMSVGLRPVATKMAQQVGTAQQPQMQGHKQSKTPLLAGSLSIGPLADGVLRSVNDTGQSGEIWLGGILPSMLDEYAPNSCLRVVSSEQPLANAPAPETPVISTASPQPEQPNTAHPYIQLQSRRGLTASVQLITPSHRLKAGQYLQEAIRVLPRTISLNVALGTELDRVERVDATSAFSTVSDIAPVAADQPANCLFAKVASSAPAPPTEEGTVPNPDKSNPDNTVTDLPARNSYGLCSLAGELFPNTRGETGEAIKTAVRRLQPQLNLLWTTKLLGLTVNEQSSHLGIMVALEAVGAENIKLLAHQQTSRAKQSPPDDKTLAVEAMPPADELVTLPAGSQIRYRLLNYGDRPLYWVLFDIGTSLNAYIYCIPYPQTTNDEEPSRQQQGLAPGETLTLPSKNDEWVTHGPPGLVTTYLVFSSAPFTHTFEVMAKQRPSSRDMAERVPLSKPQEVGKAILEDLNQASSATVEAMGIARDSSWALDVEKWATFQFMYQIV